MSNSRRLKVTASDRKPCATCGRNITPRMAEKSKDLGRGRLVCPRCVNAGILAVRLGCGHIGVPGMTVSEADRPSMSRCARCSGELGQ